MRQVYFDNRIQEILARRRNQIKIPLREVKPFNVHSTRDDASEESPRVYEIGAESCSERFLACAPRMRAIPPEDQREAHCVLEALA
jgi:hypothetical protein